MEDVALAAGQRIERNRPMIKHLLKMVWNRKRVNGLIMLEIFVSFLVLFVFLTAATFFIHNYTLPLGYDIQRVWIVTVESHLSERDNRVDLSAGLHQLRLALRDMPEIEEVGWMDMPPYSTSTWTNGRDYKGGHVDIEMNRADDGAGKALNIALVAGRWFSKEDDASKFKPVIINEQYSRLIFGSDDPIGKMPLDSTCRIVGVVKDFRKGGEFHQPVNYQINRTAVEDTSVNQYGQFVIKVRPGTTATYEAKLTRALGAVEKGWSFKIETLDHARESTLKIYLAPIIAGGLIASFLLIMVAFGLIGVLWQNVTQRTREIGLRRALGGTAQNVSRQILGEQFIITTLGVIVGVILVMQAPLLNLIDVITPGIYIAALIGALAVMYALTYLCSLFPSWLAMDIEPAEALHYE
jgi:putative ABC transport system permease protein